MFASSPNFAEYMDEAKYDKRSVQFLKEWQLKLKEYGQLNVKELEKRGYLDVEYTGVINKKIVPYGVDVDVYPAHILINRG